MPREQPELGERKSYTVRYRGNVGACEGVDDSHDPSTVDDQGLVDLVNGYVHDGIVVSRGGQTPITDPLSPMSGCVYGMIEIDGGASASPDWYLSVPTNDLVAGLGSIDTWFTSITTPADAYTRIAGDGTTNDVGYGEVGSFGPPAGAVFDSSLSRFCYANWKGDPIVVSARLDFTSLSAYSVYKLVPTPDPTLPHKTKTIEIVKLPANYTPSSVVPLTIGGTEYLFLGTLGGGVLVTDGISVYTSLAEGTLTDRVILATYHGTLYACGSQGLRRLEPGTTSSWGGAISFPTADPFPDGVVDFRPTCWCECYDELLIGGWDNNEIHGGCILSITEPTPGSPSISVKHVPTTIVGGSPRSADFISDICRSIFAGTPLVIYSYQIDLGEFSSNEAATIGSYDGTTFTDERDSLSHPEGDPSTIGRLYSSGDNLFVTGYSSLGATSAPSNEPGIFSVGISITLSRLLSTFDAIGDSNEATDMIPI